MTKLLGFGVAGIAAFTVACLAFIQLATSAPAGGSADAARAPSSPTAPVATAPRSIPRASPSRSVPPAVPAAPAMGGPTPSADTDSLVERALSPGAEALQPATAGGLEATPEGAAFPSRRPRRPSWSAEEE